MKTMKQVVLQHLLEDGLAEKGDKVYNAKIFRNMNLDFAYVGVPNKGNVRIEDDGRLSVSHGDDFSGKPQFYHCDETVASRGVVEGGRVIYLEPRSGNVAPYWCLVSEIQYFSDRFEKLDTLLVEKRHELPKPKIGKRFSKFIAWETVFLGFYPDLRREFPNELPGSENPTTEYRFRKWDFEADEWGPEIEDPNFKRRKRCEKNDESVQIQQPKKAEKVSEKEQSPTESRPLRSAMDIIMEKYSSSSAVHQAETSQEEQEDGGDYIPMGKPGATSSDREKGSDESVEPSERKKRVKKPAKKAAKATKKAPPKKVAKKAGKKKAPAKRAESKEEALMRGSIERRKKAPKPSDIKPEKITSKVKVVPKDEETPFGFAGLDRLKRTINGAVKKH